MRTDPAQLTYTNVTLISVVQRAYDVKTYQTTGASWLSEKRYDIAAKIPPDTTKEQVRNMLQNLLAERFHLVLHHEAKPLQGFALALAKGGSKLKPAAASGAPPADFSTPPKTDSAGFPQFDGPGLMMMEGIRGRAVVSYLRAQGQPISALVEMLSREFRVPVLDKTALSGKFDFTLEFAPEAPGAVATAAPASDSAPNLMTAVQEQLGLKLNPAKIPTDVLVIDAADQSPTGN